MNILMKVCLISLVAIGINGKQVKVQVYYESLSSNSMSFIVNQLYPAFATIGSEKIDLELVPWGLATETIVDETKTVVCQHGSEECYANKVHACAIDAFDVIASTGFISCAESAVFPANDADLKECATKVGISWCEIEECVKTGRGDELQSANQEKTALLNLSYVPTIIIDGSYSDENQNAAERDFEGFICGLLGDYDA
ncbi:GILT-like protein 1 [Anthonomus grandis grandis]|uniref:GILT-like protein 1 n=1 Tax=Anthonomus grandis grandis TaxID=2921223 RepID=UPI002166276A|nr:GILT-like protein 1 [Anthonomus grandis grandis]